MYPSWTLGFDAAARNIGFSKDPTHFTPMVTRVPTRGRSPVLSTYPRAPVSIIPMRDDIAISAWTRAGPFFRALVFNSYIREMKGQLHLAQTRQTIERRGTPGCPAGTAIQAGQVGLQP